MTQQDVMAALTIVVVAAAIAAMLSNVLGAEPYDPGEGDDDDDRS